MESLEVKVARLEEGMVSVKGDTSHMRKKLDSLTENHWKLSGKVVTLGASLSVMISVLTTVAMRLIMR